MLTKNVQKLLSLMLLIGLCGLAYAVVRKVKRATKSIENIDAQDKNAMGEVSGYTIYIPSPVERAVLNQMTSIWPGVFNAQYPLIASRLPKFYRSLYESGQRSNLNLGAAQMAVVRNWSIDANTASIDSLKASLLVPVTQIFSEYSNKAAALESLEPKTLDEVLKRSSTREEGACSLFRLERLFRIGQAWPKFQAEAAARYQKCMGPDDMLSVWFDLNKLLFVEKPDVTNNELRASLGKRLDTLQEKGSPYDSYLAERLSQAAFLKSTHGGSAQK